MKNTCYTSAQTVLSFKFILASMLVIFISASAFSQSSAEPKTVRGIVQSDDDHQPVPGTNIYLKGLSSVGTVSDSKGQFEFPRPLKTGDVIVFTFMGLKTTEYVVPEQSVGAIVISMPTDLIQMVDEIVVEGDEVTPIKPSIKQSLKIKTNR